MTAIDVRKLGAKGDGVTDDTALLSAAIALGIARRVPVYFPPGVYLVTGPLVDPAVRRYCLIGASSARGCHAVAVPWAASTIQFRPPDPATWLISAYTLGEGWRKGYLGPFEHRDLAFDVGDANGLRFGLPDDASDDWPEQDEADAMGGRLQALTVNVRIDGCALISTMADRTSRDGVITRSGKVQLQMTKCFEAVVSNTSFDGSDTQVSLQGCDTPTFIGIRSQFAHVPFDMQGMATYGARHTLRDVQVEGWTFTPVNSHGVETVIEGGRFEQNDQKPAGSGRFALGRAALERGNPTLVFPRPMTGILFPGLSLVEVQSHGMAIPALVEAVAGPLVTVRDVTFFPWSDPSAAVVRIHGYGPIHDSLADCHVSDTNGNASLNCPCYVYVLGRGSMHIRAGGSLGESGDNRAMIVGNRALEQFYLNSVMSFSGTSAVMCAPPEHPLAVVSGVAEDYGFDATQPNCTAPLGSLDTALASVSRAWALTPKRSGNYVNTTGVNTIPFVCVPGDPHTGQSIWCWQLGIPGESIGALVCSDPTLPSGADVWLRVRFRGRSIAAATTLVWRAFARVWDLIGPERTLRLEPAWRTHEAIIPCPPEWCDPGRTEVAGFFVQAAGVYLAGITVEEVRPAPAIANATATTTTAQLNALLATLRANGTIAP